MQVSKFERAIEEFDRNSVRRKRADSKILNAERDALRSQLDSLNKEVSEYERRKSDNASMILVDSIE